MNSEIIPPSPNWYCSRAADTNSEGIFLFAARHSICLFNARKPRAEFVGHLIGHSERVVGVVFSKNHGQSNVCASVSEDLSVRVWDIKSLSEIHRHDSHKDKPTAIDWSPLGKDLVVTGDEKGTILCWNFIDKKVKSFNHDHGHIFCLTCSPHNVAHVLVGYKNGIVLVINIGKRGGIVHKLRGHDDEVHSVVWCPVSGEDIKIRKEMSEGQCTTDALKVGNEDQTVPLPKTSGCLLASSSRDRTIRLWNMSQGKAVMTLRLPARVGGFRAKEKGDEDPRRSRVWLTLYWPQSTPRRFISSSHSGEMLCWDLGKPGKNKWEVFGQSDGISHTRIVFNISFGGDPTSSTFITTSMDRQIIKWNMETLQSEWNMPSLGGFMYCLDTSPLDPGRLAIGSGDNLIRVWNTSSLVNKHDITTFWQGIKSKVTALSWHPNIEGWLAYGTDDGRVGIYGVFSNKPPRLSSTYHKRTVYRVCWGPVCTATELTDEKQTLSLYSCAGEGIILQHNSDKLESDAVNINHIISATNDIKHIIPQRTDLSWRPNRDIVALGNEDGSIEVFRAPNLLQLCNIFVQHKLINCLKWFPNCQVSSQSESLSDNQSDKSFWLASGSSEPMIHIYDLKAALSGDEPKQCSEQITSSFCVLHGHTMKVTDLSWNPTGDGQLASASYDGTVQVWDVEKKGNPVANFRGHSGRVLAVEWSVLDEHSICSGGDDFTLMKWDITKQQHTKPPKNKKEAQLMIYSRPKGKNKQKKEKKILDKIARNTNTEEDTVSKPANEMTFDELLEQRKEEILQEKMESQKEKENETKVSDYLAVNEAEINEAVLDLKEQIHIEDGSASNIDVTQKEQVEVITCKPRKSEGKKRRKVKSLFPVSGGLDNRGKSYLQEDCIQLAEMKYGSGGANMHAGSCDQTHLGLFAGRREAYAMFREEEKNHIEAGNLDSYYSLELWKGNVVGVLKEATDKQQLTDHLVTVSTLGGHDLFLETAEAYAKQLVHFEFYAKAVTYYLACHKVYEAIDMLSQHKRLREAISLACVRLSPLDPVLKDLYSKWAQILESEGNYEQAAKCYIQIDEPVSAIRLLSRKGDKPSLATALKVATITGENEAASMLVSSFVFESLRANDWQEARSVIKSMNDVMHFQILLDVHEMLVNCLRTINPMLFTESNISSPAYNIKSQNVIDDFSSWPLYEINDKACLQYITNSFQHRNLPNDTFNWQSVYDNLLKCQQSVYGTVKFSQVLVQVAVDLSLGHLADLSSCHPKSSEHWLHAVTLSHNDGYYDLAKVLYGLIFTKDQTHSSDTYVTSHAKCLHGYYACSVLYDVWWRYSLIHQNKIGTVPKGTEDAKVDEPINKSAQSEILGQCMKDQTDVTHLLSKLDKISDVLLSAPYAQLQKLRDGIKYIQKAVSMLLTRHKEFGVDPCVETKDIVEMKNGSYSLEKKAVACEVTGASCQLESNLAYSNNHKQNDNLQKSASKDTGHQDIAESNSVANKSTESGFQNDLSANDVTENKQDKLVTNQEIATKLKSESLTNQSTDVKMEEGLSTNQCTEINNGEIEKLPDNWDAYPLDEKYKHPAVTLTILTQEQGNIVDALAKIPAEMKEQCFPCPVEMAMVLAYFSHQLYLKHSANNGVQSFCQKIIQKGESFAITKGQRMFFQKYRCKVSL